MTPDLERLQTPHRWTDSVPWALTPDGVSIAGAPPQGTPGEPVTARRIWAEFGASITQWCEALEVPAELVIATIAVETNGIANRVRLEPNFRSDETTPNQVSAGLMQTLLSTASEMMGATTTREDLMDPAISIEAGTRYIATQAVRTGLDPVYVAAAYNAGGLYLEAATANRWRLRCYPLRTGRYIDQMVLWLNDAVRMFSVINGGAPPMSFATLIPISSS